MPCHYCKCVLYPKVTESTCRLVVSYSNAIPNWQLYSNQIKAKNYSDFPYQQANKDIILVVSYSSLQGRCHERYMKGPMNMLIC